MYSFATATAWILLEDFGTVRLTVCLSSSFRMEGIVEYRPRTSSAVLPVRSWRLLRFVKEGQSDVS